MRCIFLLLFVSVASRTAADMQCVPLNKSGWEAVPSFESCAHSTQVSGGHLFFSSLRHVLAQKDTVTFLVAGGSETAGVNCDDGGIRLKACAWSARFVASLHALFPTKRFVVDNQASGGTTVSVGLPVVGSWLATTTPPDFFLVDFVVNDAAESELNASSYAAVYEALISKASSLGFSDRLAFVQTCALEFCAERRRVISMVANLHDVMVFDYAGIAKCAETISGVPAWTFWDTDTAHPTFKIHQLISDAMSVVTAAGLKCNYGDSRDSAWFTAADQLKALDFCSLPTTDHSASSSATANVTAVRWDLMEDRPGKPGWIATSDDSSIAFVVSFGALPRLMVTWLRSYEKLGDVDMTLNGRTVRLPGVYGSNDADHGNHFSQSFMHTFLVARAEFQTDTGLSGVLGFSVQPNTVHTVTFRTRPELTVGGSFKFKIIAVRSC